MTGQYRDWRTIVLTTALLTTLGSGQVHAATTYTVRTGDSLYQIAQRFGTSIAQLSALNGLDSNQWLYPGQVLSVATSLPSSTPALTNTSYVVRTGDSLFLIARRFATSIAQLQESNHLSSSEIDVGQVLTINSQSSSAAPQADNSYTVCSGDSLYQIGRRVGLTIDDLMTMNGLTNTTIYPGQVLKVKLSGQPAPTPSIPVPQPTPTPQPQPSSSPVTTDTGVTLLPGEWIKPTGNSTFQIIMMPDPTGLTQDQLDLYWLSRIISAEAGAESYDGKVAVGNVILNRVKSSQFPTSIKDVIFDDYQGIPQFSPTLDGSLRQTPSSDCVKAAQDALKGVRPVGGALYFLNPAKVGVTWIQQNRTYLMTIGGHDFYL